MSIRSRVRSSRVAVRVSDWRADRTVERGRRDVLRRAADQVRSRTPVYRSRPNPVYAGAPHSHDVSIGRGIDQALTKDLAARRLADRARHPSVRTRDSEGRAAR